MLFPTPLRLAILWTDATLLAVVGIFSLQHYATALRTREFGVRFALAATRSNVVALVIWDGVLLASIGALAGASAAIAPGRAFSSLLFGVQPAVNPAEALRAE